MIIILEGLLFFCFFGIIYSLEVPYLPIFCFNFPNIPKLQFQLDISNSMAVFRAKNKDLYLIGVLVLWLSL